MLVKITDDASSYGSDNYVDTADKSSGVASSFRSSAERHEDEHEEESKLRVASKESRQVMYSKILVALVLTVSAALAGFFTYHFISTQKEDEFQRKFEVYADELIAVSEAKANTAFRKMGAFGAEITSLASYGNMEWPFVTIEGFHVRASDYQKLTGVTSNTLCPVVAADQRAAWTNYSLANKWWIHDGYEAMNVTDGDDSFMPVIYSIDENFTINPATGPESTAIIWQSFPASAQYVNYHLDSSPLFIGPKQAADKARRAILTSLDLLDVNLDDFPTSIVFQPIMKSFNAGAEIGAYLLINLPWNVYFENVLSETKHPVQLVVSNECGGVFSLNIAGPEVEFLGHADLHDKNMDDWVVTSQFAEDSTIYLNETEAAGEERCLHYLHIYPSSQMKKEYDTMLPLGMTIGVVLVFVCTSMIFIFYDFLLQRQNRRMAKTVQRSNELVTNLFPKEYRERLFGDENEDGEFLHKTSVKSPLLLGRHSAPGSFAEQDKSELEDGDGVDMYTSPPVADLFHDCTVMEADIAGFTAWSSTREPAMVFELLESLYGAFDEIAQRRRVFKVETVGDAYVAVAGLPTPRRDHAAVMVRFAHDCLTKMTALTNELEVRLGPGTAALSMRFGLHSGSVIAGVLRGDGLRFQIFGDTVDIAEALEQHSANNKIHISEETASLLRDAGKSHWIQAREKRIEIRSKGTVQTYWVFPKTGDASSTHSGSSAELGNTNQYALTTERAQLKGDTYPSSSNIGSEDKHTLDPKSHRLVEWNVQILTRILKQVVAKHQGSLIELDPETTTKSTLTTKEGMTPLEEVKEIVHLPTYCRMRKEVNPEDVALSHAVQQQLGTLVLTFATQYRNDNAFHNFEHASHVTMSVVKLLSRIIRPEGADGTDALHDRTYGITSDPLLQFAVVLSALVHDLDHSGVPNVTLVKEGHKLAVQYKNKSVAEQHSVDLAWSILMDSKYDDLRKCIYSTQEELERFRSVLINVVLATDIADKDLGALRKARWNKAFKLGDAADHLDENPKDAVDRKATIVVEHLIQASDIAHTMQHWHVYRKWNEKLFQEVLAAYKAGRLDVDPALKWYEGEIGFFDFYIIPLAKKLKDCGVFGVSSDEYLDYALANRREWVQRGRDVVKEYVARYASDSKPEVLAGQQGATKEIDV